MTFGNSKRMALVKGFLKEEKKKSNSKRSLHSVSSSKGLSLATLSINTPSHHSASNKSVASYCSSSSYGTDDPLHWKSILKMQRTWEIVKQAMPSKEIGATILQKCKTTKKNNMDVTTTRCLVLVETLDCIIYLLSPDMDIDDLKSSTGTMIEHNIPMMEVAEILPDAMEDCLGKAISVNERDIWHDSLGQTLINMSTVIA